MQRVGSVDEAIKLIDQNTVIYILGAGKDGKSCASQLLKHGFKVRYFVDEDKRKIGKSIEGVKVVFPNEIEESSMKRIFLLCIGEISFYSDEYIESLPICCQIRNKKEVIIIDKQTAVLNKFKIDCKQNDINLLDEFIKIGNMVLPNFLEISEPIKKIFLSECNDLIMPVFFDDYSMVDEGPYEIDEVQVMPGDIVINAGANLGLFSAYVASKKGLAYAFEPIPKTIELLELTSKKYGGSIRIIPKALSDKNGTVQMTDIEYLGQNRICRYDFDNKELIDVNAITLDQFAETLSLNRVDFIKADIEGEERNMLLGATNILKKFSPKLSICTYHNEDDPIILEDIIKQANPAYKVIHRFKKLYAYIDINEER
ncbi:MAG: FkbM family methyltransferase [Hungatella sp.]|nr:FkbM family methyltransferase [Hungatella sp.]